jgi:hypothetical protein
MPNLKRIFPSDPKNDWSPVAVQTDPDCGGVPTVGTATATLMVELLEVEDELDSTTR